MDVVGGFFGAAANSAVESFRSRSLVKLDRKVFARDHPAIRINSARRERETESHFVAVGLWAQSGPAATPLASFCPSSAILRIFVRGAMNFYITVTIIAVLFAVLFAISRR